MTSMELPQQIKEELQAIQKMYGRPRYVVYRADDRARHREYRGVRAFSTSLDHDVAGGYGGYVYEFRPEASQILIDTTLFNDELAWPDEKEVILLPGVYSVTGFWEGCSAGGVPPP